MNGLKVIILISTKLIILIISHVGIIIAARLANLVATYFDIETKTLNKVAANIIRFTVLGQDILLLCKLLKFLF